MTDTRIIAQRTALPRCYVRVVNPTLFFPSQSASVLVRQGVEFEDVVSACTGFEVLHRNPWAGKGLAVSSVFQTHLQLVIK